MRRSHRTAHRALWPALAVAVGLGLALALALRAPPAAGHGTTIAPVGVVR
jgi:hypothetical protein